MAGEYKIPRFLSAEASSILSGILNIDPQKRFTIEQIRAHPWFQLNSMKPRKGIVVGVHQIPVETKILEQMPRYGFEIEHVKKCVEANKHNEASTTYYLLLKKYIREGGTSKADINSEEFEPVTIGASLQISRESRLSSTELNPTNNNQEIFLKTSSQQRKLLNLSTSKTLESTGGSLITEKIAKSSKTPLGRERPTRLSVNSGLMDYLMNTFNRTEKRAKHSMDLNSTVPMAENRPKIKIRLGRNSISGKNDLPESRGRSCLEGKKVSLCTPITNFSAIKPQEKTYVIDNILNDCRGIALPGQCQTTTSKTTPFPICFPLPQRTGPHITRGSCRPPISLMKVGTPKNAPLPESRNQGRGHLSGSQNSSKDAKKSQDNPPNSHILSKPPCKKNNISIFTKKRPGRAITSLDAHINSVQKALYGSTRSKSPIRPSKQALYL